MSVNEIIITIIMGGDPRIMEDLRGQMDFYSLISCDVGSGCLGPAAEMNYQVLPGLGQEEIND